MKIHFKNHPVHIMLAHFPSALFPTSLIFNAFGWFDQQPILTKSSLYCQLAGVVLGWITILVGVIDLYGIYERKENDLIQTGILHGGTNTFVVLIFTGLVVYRLKHNMEYDIWMLAIELFAVIFLLIGNFFGGEIYQQIIKRRFA